MTDDEKRKLVAKLQAQTDAQWEHPRSIDLDGPGPFELPLCGHVSALGAGSDHTFVLLLETAKAGQPIRIPLQSVDLPALKGIVDLLHAQFLASLPNGPMN